MLVHTVRDASVIALFFRLWTVNDWQAKGFMGWDYAVERKVGIVCFTNATSTGFVPYFLALKQGLDKFEGGHAYRVATFVSFV